MPYNPALSREQAAENTKNKVEIKHLINFDKNTGPVKVSVVVPICNVEKYLKPCLDSILQQTLKEIEIICVNDGSKDSSESILESYARRDARVKIIDKANAGYGHTMNIGMDMAKGEYVAIIESDDYAEPDMLEILYTTAVKNDLDVVKSDYYTFNTTEMRKKQSYESTCLGKREYYNRVLSPLKEKIIFTFLMNTWTGIYRRSFLEEKNIRHNETPGASYQDNGFWFQTISQAQSVYFVDKAFYHYRQDNPNSSINSKGKVFCMNEEYDFIYSFLEAHPDLKEEFLVQFFTKRFHNYMHTYARIAEEYRIPFLQRFSEELKKMQKEKIINFYTFPDHWVAQMCLRIMDDYECFYLEDTLYRLESDLANARERLGRLYASREMKNGWIIKRIFKRG